MQQVIFNVDGAANARLLLRLAESLSFVRSATVGRAGKAPATADDAFEGMGGKEEEQLWLRLAESSMAEEWDDPANDHWDEFFATAPKL